LKIVSSDGVGPNGHFQYDNWFVAMNPREGSRKNFWRLCKAASEVNAERLIFLEDDVTVVPGAIQTMSEMVIPGACAFVTCFDATTMEDPSPDGLYERLIPGVFQHSQALVIPGASLRVLARHEPTRYMYMGPDNWLSEVFAGQGYGIHVPSLVDHVGQISVAHEFASGLRARNLRPAPNVSFAHKERTGINQHKGD
jgi:hypothetical protein